ncbi:MAG: hypothetical protein ACN6QT_04330 [Burkholderia contaminans]|uniref:hypothetical protein n=1 Tax=Burkholderia cepacia complex TaxID=87882 RepID=UPI001B97077C|nr:MULTISPECIES: hypothetical protein [Burkholderia cepacia complex]MBR7913109.1 hypothetical protein [Burkholderia vietnamiensis]HDR8918317.1 hypothetical protein [Burkholderia vietnamiensis]HDR8976615.1 hypothetical protein [Burkholderia vietnamiensis]HDR9067122.1 hypothetical protein [Burkholderia vietnamiensis]HDR9277496.1 hypothetical protein [Burkholderia vietnamiensis]
MSNALNEYRQALQRLEEGRPQIVPKGTRITNDAVALEAGRGKGSIKKSREMFAELIAEISAAAARHAKLGANDAGSAIKAAKDRAEQYRRLWEDALAREASLLMELLEVRREMARLTGEKVLPIRRRREG